ncbi:mannonate dehydratase [Chloroflexi bacterium TSY]|nr:mannonate dehydratase [Chloroflexi bacterium TSY]
MKLGLGLYRQMLTPDNFRFARQAGATHIVAHLTDYFKDAESLSTASGGDVWGITQNQDRLWSYEELRDLRMTVEAEGLQLAALENFDPSHWYDILLDGPQKAWQTENLKTIIRNMGRAGIPCMGYYFSVAGVWGRVSTRGARGQAETVGFVAEQAPSHEPIPHGEVWNMIYDPEAPPGTIDPVSSEQIWQRLNDFLTELVPIAEEAGVRLAAHPDDPPLPVVRNTARLVYQRSGYQRLLDLVSSSSNGLEFCLGTLAEMEEDEMFDDFYQMVDHYSKQDKIGYIHCRNIRGTIPNYHEVFIDEGDIDIVRVLRILHRNGFDGVIIPDHTPQMTCGAPWYAGMAYALGYLKAVMRMIEET